MDNIKHLMDTLHCTEEEAKDIAKWDSDIEDGKDNGKLSADKEKASKEIRQVDHAPTNYKFSKREKKSDIDKSLLITYLAESLKNLSDNVKVANPERELSFQYNGRKFKIVLSAPRS